MKARIGIALVGCLSALFLVSTSGGVVAGDTGQSANDYAEPDVLIQKANALGKSELARLAAAEMVYRDRVFIHCYELTETQGQPKRVYMKLYRRYTGFEVVDIERSPSILTPLKVTIRFNFDRAGTRPESGGIADVALARRVEGDVTVVVHDSQAIVREYFCTAKGEPLKLPSPILERPNIWSKGGPPSKYGNYWLENPYAPPGS